MSSSPIKEVKQQNLPNTAEIQLRPVSSSTSLVAIETDLRSGEFNEGNNLSIVSEIPKYNNQPTSDSLEDFMLLRKGKLNPQLAFSLPRYKSPGKWNWGRLTSVFLVHQYSILLTVSHNLAVCSNYMVNNTEVQHNSKSEQ